MTAALPAGTRAGGLADGDSAAVLHVPGEPGRAVLADDAGRGSVALLLALPLAATLAALAAGAAHLGRGERRARPVRPS
ncbi:hypothetical protein AB0K92_00885 [Streptomyces sp. NPDC052687]|uniref:hypothetical protein n=1 Tax=Streptomyces sp. NPDC052687 TaxID=3154759 RepID=UPI0034164C88